MVQLKHKLPPLLKEIADVAGIEAALALAGRYGGEQVLIPANRKRLRGDYWLVQCVGDEAAARLVDYFAPRGVRLNIPFGPMRRFFPLSFISVEERGEAVARAAHKGMTARQMARQFGVTMRTIWRWKKAARTKEKSVNHDRKSGQPLDIVHRLQKPFQQGV